ncbi:MAG TPA: FliG C-terminal domain-containing protein [Pirellulaceae bacterium]|jgi:flagellar motor switch protein FliG|nr:FliG C-terminal domain-containing protein [Pirellulaceae bacterium]
MAEPEIKPSVRKVAALLASVDRATAERLLAKLPPEKAREALAAARKLGELSQRERRAAIDEFRREAGKSQAKSARDVAAAEETQIELSISPQARKLSESAGPPSPFRFLEEAQDEELAACLKGENSQIVAVALAHLSPARGGRLLQELDDPARTAAMERFSALDDSDAELAREAEAEIATHLRDKLAAMRKKTKRLDRLREILNAAGLPEAGVLPGPMKSDLAPSPVRREIGTVGDDDDSPDVLPLRRGTSVADAPPPDSFEALPPEELSRQFSRLWTLPATSLALLCERASTNNLLCAMAGAEPEDAERFLTLFPKVEAKAFRDRLSETFPLSLAQIERAQQELLVLAGALSDDDLI